MSWTVPPQAAGERLVDHLRDHLVVVAHRAVGELCKTGAIEVDGQPGAIATLLTGGEVVTVAPDAITALVTQHRAVVPVDAPLAILHLDDDLIVVDVPHDLHVAPTGGHGEDSVVTRLLWHLGARPDHPWASARPRPVHRLDRATGGLLALATSASAADAVQRSLRAGEVHRTYRAVVEGDVLGADGVIDAPIGRGPDGGYRRAVVADGQSARTRWTVTSRQPETTTLSVELDTGRTHQVRVHLAHLGHPIVGDELYGATPRHAPGIALRAVRLQLPHPVSGGPVDVQLAIDDDDIEGTALED